MALFPLPCTDKEAERRKDGGRREREHKESFGVKENSDVDESGHESIELVEFCTRISRIQAPEGISFARFVAFCNQEFRATGGGADGDAQRVGKSDCGGLKHGCNAFGQHVVVFPDPVLALLFCAEITGPDVWLPRDVLSLRFD